ncbi:heavy metal-binding domain-containing protein [Coraliomargarita sp. SDUM461003]|uniref:Heavy metal-binding domain-containing protein n=1 Tax=Thalassobacterium maritimum TaxID=3041265 RepID=A0ABU1AZ65_9BACT|nr:heavy metal-binding domain-containing protein [Coraliomargarita sp. SDUM461003]MDQ8209427.1 heavy metal-binding domain-containing protein [Coraliomargarita sp. SDUM461003]
MDDSADTINLLLLILVYGMPVFLAVFGLVVGSILERRHFASIRQRELQHARLPIFPTRSADADRTVVDGHLVVASVVVSLDYFKKILASLRNIFGGNVRSYESLLDRAKREAILRLKEQVPDCDAIINLRLETSNLANVHSRKKGIGGVEVIAYGTAIRYRSEN